jgi:hypothetical protein
MDAKTIAEIRARVLLALEDMGGCCTRLRELEDESGGLANLGDYEEDLQSWFASASEQMKEAWLIVESSKMDTLKTEKVK